MNNDINLLELLTVGGRLLDERSRASPAEYYRDPSNVVKFNRDPMEKTKAIEQILQYEIQNWMQWGRRRDWMPVSFRCPLGYLYKSSDVMSGTPVRRPQVNEVGAGAFERMVVSLPEKHRQAFVMHHLGRAAVKGQIKILKGYDQNAQLLGVAKSKYYEFVQQAHSMVLRKVVYEKNILATVENRAN